MKRILGIDPGKNTGWALIKLVARDITVTPVFGVDKNESIDSIRDLVKQGEVDTLVIEDFLVRPDKAKDGSFDYSNMPAIRIIGRVEEIAELTGLEIVKQPASLKPPAYGFAGMKYVPGKKGQHWQDALAHAVYYCVKKLNAKPLTRGSS